MSESAAARLTEAAGAAYVAEQAAAVERLERQPTPEPAGPGLLQLSADGAMISLVGKQWVEVKTLALGRVVQEANGTVRTTDLSYFSRRAEWFVPMDGPHTVLWWVPVGHEPTPAEGRERLDHLAAARMLQEYLESRGPTEALR